MSERLEQLIHELCLPDQDPTWQEWCDLQAGIGFDEKALNSLLSNLRIKPGYKARVLIGALSPALEPVYWPISRDRQFPPKVSLKGISTALRELCLRLIEKYQPVMKGQCDRAVVKHGWFSDDDNWAMGWMNRYNEYLRELLSILPKGSLLADPVFDLYQLNDPIPYSDSPMVSHGTGYTPFRDLLADPAISHEWKRKADWKMREIIKAEIRKEAMPRQTHEIALQCYARQVIQFAAQSELPYSPDLLVNQLSFILYYAGMPAASLDELVKIGQTLEHLRRATPPLGSQVGYQLVQWMIDYHGRLDPPFADFSREDLTAMISFMRQLGRPIPNMLRSVRADRNRAWRSDPAIQRGRQLCDVLARMRV